MTIFPRTARQAAAPLTMAAEHRFGIGQYAVGQGHFKQAMRGWCEMDAFTPPAPPAAWQSRHSVATALRLGSGRSSPWNFRTRLTAGPRLVFWNTADPKSVEEGRRVT